MRNNKNKDNRIDCFFKPASDMSLHTINDIVDALTKMDISIKASSHATSVGFFIVPQRVSIEKREIIESTVKIITNEHPLWIIIEEDCGTTYSYQI